MFKKKLILIPALLFALTSCGGDDPTTGSTTTTTDQTTVTGTTDQTTSKDDTTSQTVEVESVTIKNKDYIKSVCDEGWYVGSAAIELDVEILPAGSLDPFYAEYTTSDPNVASVSSGTVVAIGEGTATITVTAGDFSDHVDVTVSGVDTVSIAELRQHAKDEDHNDAFYNFDGVVIAQLYNGPVIEDETGYVYAYKCGQDLEVGDYVLGTTQLDYYNGLHELVNATFEVLDEEPDFEQLTTPVVWDAEDVDSYDGSCTLFEATGKLVKSGNYYNIYVDGAEKNDLSIYGSVNGAYDEYANMYVKFTGYPLYIAGGSHINFALKTIELTDQPEPPAIVKGSIAEVKDESKGTPVETAGVVIGRTDRSYLIDDNTGKILVFGYDMPEFNLNDYITVSGTIDSYNSQPQIANPTVAKSSETGPSLSNVIATWTATELDAYDFTTNDYVSITGTFELDGNYPILTVAGATKDVRASYPLDSLGLDSSLNGRTLTFKGFMVGGSGNRAHMIVNEVEVGAYDDVTSVAIDEPTSTEVYVGGTLQLNATVLPATADPAITWETSDDTTATVSTTGLVTGVKEGNVTITAKSTADATKLDTIELSVVEPEGTLVEKVLAEYDFGGLTGKGTGLNSDTGLTAFNNSYVEANSLSNSLVSVSLTNVYDGNGEGKCFYPNTSGLIKTGTSSKNGIIELTLSEDVSVTKVEVVAQPWSETSGDTMSVNDGEAKTLPVEADTVTSFEGNFGNVVKIETAKRAFIFNIKLYVKVIETGENVPVESVTLNHTELSMVTGETVTLVASVSPITATDKTVTWTSSDEDVATVDNGTVTAVSGGTATITAKAGEKTATCLVNVTTEVNYDISQITKAGEYTIRGLVAAKNSKALVVSDGDDSIYVFDNTLPEKYNINDYVEVTGNVSEYSNAFQFNYSGLSVTKLSEEHEIVLPAAEELTAEKLNSLLAQDSYSTKDIKLYKWTATAAKDGTYDTLNVEGCNVSVEPVYLPSDFTITAGTTYEVEAYFVGYYNYVSIVLTKLTPVA